MPLDTNVNCETGDVTQANITLPPAGVPQEVSPLQMRRALRALGLKPAIDAFVASKGDEAQEAWDYAVAIRRDDPLVELARAALGKSQAELDDIFRLAATITAASI